MARIDFHTDKAETGGGYSAFRAIESVVSLNALSVDGATRWLEPKGVGRVVEWVGSSLAEDVRPSHPALGERERCAAGGDLTETGIGTFVQLLDNNEHASV